LTFLRSNIIIDKEEKPDFLNQRKNGFCSEKKWKICFFLLQLFIIENKIMIGLLILLSWNTLKKHTIKSWRASSSMQHTWWTMLHLLSKIITDKQEKTNFFSERKKERTISVKKNGLF